MQENVMQEHIAKIKQSASSVHGEFRKRIATYVTAAFGLVAGLAWNDAIKALINLLFPLEPDSVLAKFIYAILLTVVLVLLSLYIFRFLAPEKKKDTSAESGRK